ncbi:TonB-dependent receptor [Phenylobacterium sp.]|uniref:TonB-dependent receptor n=1 Tax=Phenylobacterium sp. TaxID=1871053 RepID=UPI0035B0E82B
MRQLATIGLLASTASLALTGAAAAQGTAGAAQVEEIVVTAQKREQNLQDVPVAVSAFGENQLQAQAVGNLTDLSAKAPNVVLAPVGAYPYASAFFIRGLGFADVESTFEPSVGVEMNGVYLARNSGALQDFFDVASVEVLRGPQGTLYGRNTIGGVVSVRTKTPVPGDPMSGAVQATIGDNGREEGRFAVNVPLGDIFAARVSMLYKSYDGYNHNVTLNRKEGDNDVHSGRLTLVAKPNDVFNATLVADFDQEKGSGASFRNASLPSQVYYNFSPDTGSPVYSAADLAKASDVYNVYGDTPTSAKIATWGLALTMNYDLGFGQVTSITGYRKFKDKVLSDYDASPVNFFYAFRDQTHEQFSQELRLAGKTDRLDYVVGLYYLDQSYDITNAQGGLIYGGATPAQVAGQKNTGYAVFGQADYKLTDALTLTAGGRWSYEKKEFTNQPLFYPASMTYKHDWDNFSPKLGVNYQFNPLVMAYASWSRGFRSGGYNGRAASYTSAGPYNAETVDSFEAGVKSEVFDRRLRLNGAVFSSIYKDMQTGAQGLTSAGVYESIVTNAGKAKISGAEAEALWIVGGGLRVNANLAYLDAAFEDNFTDLTSDGVDNPTDNSDLPMIYAPKWSGSLGFTWTRDVGVGDLTLNANAVYTDDMYTSGGVINRTSDVQVRKANTLYDATVTLEGAAGWKLALWGKNLTDEKVINNTFGLGALGELRIYQPPRTWGLELGYKF